MPRDQFDAVLIAIRRIIRAIDLQSRKLVQSHGLTGPQALILKEVNRSQGLTAGELALKVSLSQATITGRICQTVLRADKLGTKSVALCSTTTGRVDGCRRA